MGSSHIKHEGFLGEFKEAVHKMILAEQGICLVLSVVFIGLMMIQVVMRYVFNAPIYGIEEWVTALMIWYCAMGVVVVYWEKGHAMIGFMTKYMNNSTQKAILIIAEGIVVILSCVFIKTGIVMFQLQSGLSPVGGVPFNKSWYYALPVVVMGVTMLCAGVFRLIETIATKQVKKLMEERVSLD